MNKKDLTAFLSNYRKGSEKLKTSSAYKKLQNYFTRLVQGDRFRQSVLKIRAKFKIPNSGYFYDNQPLPAEWPYRGSEKAYYALCNEVKKLCRRFELNYLEWDELIIHFIFFDTLDEIPWYQNSFNLLAVEDLGVARKSHKEWEEFPALVHPVALRISPYASERDIVDYVKKTYSTSIRPLQDKYRNKKSMIGKIRASKRRGVQERNDFIYTYRSLNRRKLADLVNEKFVGVGKRLSYSDINIIIARERKIRQKM